MSKTNDQTLKDLEIAFNTIGMMIYMLTHALALEGKVFWGHRELVIGMYLIE